MKYMIEYINRLNAMDNLKARIAAVVCFIKYSECVESIDDKNGWLQELIKLQDELIQIQDDLLNIEGE